MAELVALGELLIDFAPRGTDREGNPLLAVQPGGAPGNFLAAASRYGISTALLAKVGEDAFGRLLVEALAGAGVETRGVRLDPAVFTTLAFVTLDGQGDRSFSFARMPGADTCLTFSELDLALLEGARAFHFGSLSLTDEPVRTCTYQAVAYAKERGKLITFDPNLRPPLWRTPQEARREILWGLGQAQVVKLSGEEAAFLWGCNPLEGARQLLDTFPQVQLVLLTLGEAGCLLQNRRAACRLGALKVQPVDTTGAGDIFGGAAISQLLRLDTPPGELSAEELGWVARFATAAAGLSTLRPGGIPSVPPLGQVEAQAAAIEAEGGSEG